MKNKISKESVKKIADIKKIDTSKYVEINNADELGLGKSLTDLIYEAYKEGLKNDIRANTVMISDRLAKVNRFIQTFIPNSYAEFPPLICGLEAYVTDELPKEFAFGLVEAPTTQREVVFENGRRKGYREGYEECAREIFEEIEELLNLQAKIVCETRGKYRETDEPMLSFIAMLDGRIYSLRVIEEHIAELKKKYTEERK